jgi:hypothetical protein
MSPPGDSGNGARTPEEGIGVLANLPRTRPQRSTPRRTAARSAGGTASKPASPRKAAGAASKAPASSTAKARSATKSGKTKPAPRAPAKPRAASAPKRPPRPRPVSEAVPRQGFESEGDRASGPVQPPGGAEFLATAAEIVSELTRAGVSTGERLVRDILSRLPLS